MNSTVKLVIIYKFTWRLSFDCSSLITVGFQNLLGIRMHSMTNIFLMFNSGPTSVTTNQVRLLNLLDTSLLSHFLILNSHVIRHSDTLSWGKVAELIYQLSEIVPVFFRGKFLVYANPKYVRQCKE